MGYFTKMSIVKACLSVVLSTLIVVEAPPSYSFVTEFTNLLNKAVMPSEKFGILYDAAGRIASQKVNDPGAGLLFGNESLYEFVYDEKTGKLLETTITNNDYTMVLDSEGNRKSLTLSARMIAYLAEQEAKARAAAERESRRSSSRRADGRFAPKGAKLISRSEVLEGGSKSSKKSRTKAATYASELSLRGDRRSPKQSPKKLAKPLAAKPGKSVDERALSRTQTRSVIARRAEGPTKQSPQEKNQIRRITEVYEITIDGKVHRIRETRRVDAEGNLLSRTLTDSFKFKNERGKTVRATIKSYFDSQNRLTHVTEKYKQRVKGGTATTKRTTWYDPDGNILRQKEKTSFKKSGFFNSTFGKILGIAATVAGAFIGAAILGPVIGGFLPILKSIEIGATTLASVIGASIGTGIAQLGVSVAQGASFKDALKSALVSSGAVLATAGIAKFFSGFTDVTALGKILQNFGNNLTTSLAASASKFTWPSFFQQLSIRAAAQQFETNFGKKLGAFGTAALISLGSAVAGQLFNPSSAAATPTATPGVNQAQVASSLSTSPTTISFDATYFKPSSLVIRALAQGAIAEAFKKEKGLSAQFARETLSLSTAGLSKEVVGETFSAIKDTVNTTLIQPISKAGSATLKLFDPRTEFGRNNIVAARILDDLGVKREQIQFPVNAVSARSDLKESIELREAVKGAIDEVLSRSSYAVTPVGRMSDGNYLGVMIRQGNPKQGDSLFNFVELNSSGQIVGFVNPDVAKAAQSFSGVTPIRTGVSGIMPTGFEYQGLPGVIPQSKVGEPLSTYEIMTLTALGGAAALMGGAVAGVTISEILGGLTAAKTAVTEFAINAGARTAVTSYLLQQKGAEWLAKAQDFYLRNAVQISEAGNRLLNGAASRYYQTARVANTLALVDAAQGVVFESLRPGSTLQSTINAGIARYLGARAGFLFAPATQQLLPRLATAAGVGVGADILSTKFIEGKNPSPYSSISSGVGGALGRFLGDIWGNRPYKAGLTTRAIMLIPRSVLFYYQNYRRAD